MLRSARPSVCLSVPSFWLNNGTLIGNPTLQFEPSVVAWPPGSGRNGNETVAGAASEAFNRWLHHRYATNELLSAGRTVLRRDSLLIYRFDYTYYTATQKIERALMTSYRPSIVTFPLS